MPVESIKCPNCGAPLEVVSEIMRCPYCSTNVHVQLDNGEKKAVVISGPMTKEDEKVNELAAMLAKLYRQGQKIQAIKLYRELTGDGLADAKNAVEGLAQGLSMPEVMEKLRVRIKHA